MQDLQDCLVDHRLIVGALLGNHRCGSMRKHGCPSNPQSWTIRKNQRQHNSCCGHDPTCTHRKCSDEEMRLYRGLGTDDLPTTSEILTSLQHNGRHRME